MQSSPSFRVSFSEREKGIRLGLPYWPLASVPCCGHSLSSSEGRSCVVLGHSWIPLAKYHPQTTSVSDSDFHTALGGLWGSREVSEGSLQGRIGETHKGWCPFPSLPATVFICVDMLKVV